jgi:hypothetical protein
MQKYFGFLANEVFLGTLIGLLSIFTAIPSYQGAMADSEQNKHEILGMQYLNDGNAEYLTANQQILQDYTYYDNWYLNQEVNPEVSDYYYAEFSDTLLTAIDRSGQENPFDDQYYDEMYAYPSSLFDESDAGFETGALWDERGDQLQLVVLIMALGLAFTAWSSLLGAESRMRLVFALAGLLMFAAGLYTYFALVPPIPS